MQGTRRTIRTTALFVGLGTLAIGLAVSPQAHATYYQVSNTTSDNYSLSDGVCSFREAIRAVNERRQIDACPAGQYDSEIEIVGDPTKIFSLVLTDNIEITNSSLSISAAFGNDRYQTIAGNATRFIVHPGSALYVQGLTMTGFKNTVFVVEGGVVSGHGFVQGQLILSNVELSNNIASVGNSQSGGILLQSGYAYLFAVKMHDNQGPKGAAIGSQYGNLELYKSSLYNNSGSQYGPGLMMNGSTATANLYNVTISGNSAPDAPAIDVEGGATLTMTWSTVTKNRATAGTSSTSAIRNISSTVRIGTSIVTGNTTAKNCSGAISSTGYNAATSCLSSTTTGDNTTNGAVLGPLTIPSGGNNAYTYTAYHLPSNESATRNTIPANSSACLNGGDDQLDHHRPLGGKCDPGAIEIP